MQIAENRKPDIPFRDWKVRNDDGSAPSFDQSKTLQRHGVRYPSTGHPFGTEHDKRFIVLLHLPEGRKRQPRVFQQPNS